MGKGSSCNTGDSEDEGSIPESGRFPGEGHGNSLQSLAWRIPWTEEPGGRQCKGSQSRTLPSDQRYFYAAASLLRSLSTSFMKSFPLSSLFSFPFYCSSPKIRSFLHMRYLLDRWLLYMDNLCFCLCVGFSPPEVLKLTLSISLLHEMIPVVFSEINVYSKQCLL